AHKRPAQIRFGSAVVQREAEGDSNLISTKIEEVPESSSVSAAERVTHNRRWGCTWNWSRIAARLTAKTLPTKACNEIDLGFLLVFEIFDIDLVKLTLQIELFDLRTPIHR